MSHQHDLIWLRASVGTQSLCESTRDVPNLVFVSDLQMIVSLHGLQDEIAISIEWIRRVLDPHTLSVSHDHIDVRVGLPIWKDVLSG